jgi:hypothetical protein
MAPICRLIHAAFLKHRTALKGTENGLKTFAIGSGL